MLDTVPMAAKRPLEADGAEPSAIAQFPQWSCVLDGDYDLTPQKFSTVPVPLTFVGAGTNPSFLPDTQPWPFAGRARPRNTLTPTPASRSEIECAGLPLIARLFNGAFLHTHSPMDLVDSYHCFFRRFHLHG
jgi:hypothetical protein